jgi:endogenous inhibitor of DNA gyrase (YacG/DUF329 family)
MAGMTVLASGDPASGLPASEAVAYAAPGRALTADRPETGTSRSAWRCPECLAPFKAIQRHQLFCTKACKNAFHQRWRTRGAMLVPLAAADRATRGGTRGNTAIGRRARGDSQMLLQRWREEDAAAGRMPMVEYMAERYRLGLVEVA